jgi:hypothetical protein
MVRLSTALVLILSAAHADASTEARRFDIPPQPLAGALVAFADRTGMTALVDAQLAGGKRSTAVKGLLTPQDALRLLLAGTGLSFRRAGDTAFSVGPNTAAPPIEVPTGSRGDYQIYFAQMQNAIEHILCSNADIRPGLYRTVVQVWIGSAGAVDAIHAVSSSGDETRDARVADTIARIRLAPPPSSLPQPVTVILNRSASDAACMAAR